jgi:hypothetical protein
MHVNMPHSSHCMDNTAPPHHQSDESEPGNMLTLCLSRYCTLSNNRADAGQQHTNPNRLSEANNTTAEARHHVHRVRLSSRHTRQTRRSTSTITNNIPCTSGLQPIASRVAFIQSYFPSLLSMCSSRFKVPCFFDVAPRHQCTSRITRRCAQPLQHCHEEQFHQSKLY